MFRETAQSDELRQQILLGIKEVSDIVSQTLGSKGRNVVLDVNPFDDPIITNDGVTIVREFNSKDKFKNIGIKLVREVAGRTNDQAGDGTTTATILFYEICRSVQKALANEADSLALRRGIEHATKEIIEAVKKQAKKTSDLEDLYNIAKISSGSEELGKTISNLVSELGEEALITLEDSPEVETTSERTEGLRLRGGILSQVFITNQAQQQAVLNDAAVLVTNLELTTQEEMIRIMEIVAGSGKKDAVIIAERIDGQALMTAVINKLKGQINIVPIRVQAYGAIADGYLEDIAKVTGGTYFTAETGYKLSELTINNFGKADKIVSTRESTTIIGGNGDKDARIEELEGQLKNSDDLGDYAKESLTERIAKLKSAIGVIKVGGTTDVERKERKARVEDAVNATKAALSDGIVTGGATALYRALSKTNFQGGLSQDELIGDKAVRTACIALLKQHAKNSSMTLDNQMLGDILADGKAIDFNTGKLVDAYKEGIIDPVKVVVSALQNAAAQAGSFATTEGGLVVIDDPKIEPVQQ